MFIIPIQDRVDWRKPPVLTLALVIINSLIYFWTVGYDAKRYEALNRLDTTQLVAYEWAPYLEWLGETDPGRWLEVRDRRAAAQESVLESAWIDRSFDQRIHALWQKSPPDAVWRDVRTQLEQTRNEISWIRWGFTPALPEFSDALTSMFLHADPWHLFGNMLFLLLFAIPLERHWGAGRLLGLYLLSGLCGDALHWLAAMDSYTPSVGASGAIAGLMGIYVGTYGVRRIEFFYTVGFLFGSFRAPAIMVFPVWLLYELLQNALSDSNVNYLAHAGGMAGGLLLVLALRWLSPRKVFDVVEDTPQPAERKMDTVPAYLRRLNEALAFAQVLKESKLLLTEQSDNQALWHFYFDAARKCGNAALDQAMREALSLLNNAKPKDALVSALLEDYHSGAGDMTRLPPPFQLLEAELHFRRRDLHLARKRVMALEKVWSHARLKRLQEQLF